MATISLTSRPCLVDIKFKTIRSEAEVKNEPKKVILNDVTGKFEHGKLHAIMGPSGAGKSSLLNVLAGLNTKATGKITLNQRKPAFEVSEWGQFVKQIRSYVMQDDFMVPELTVEETLAFAASMNRSEASTTEMRQRLINQLLGLLGLLETRSRLISALSGGQRKRVSVACELVNFKPLIFLDEPTTGLDSNSTYKLIDLLKSVAKSGCNVIATIHQPSSRVFNLFDTLTVLAPGGRMAYSGPPTALVGTIQKLTGKLAAERCNPADFLFESSIIVEMAEYSTKMQQKTIITCQLQFEKSAVSQEMRKFQSSLECGSNETTNEMDGHSCKISFPAFSDSGSLVETCQRSLPSRRKRFAELFKRAIIQTKRDKVFLMGRLVAYVLVMIILGTLFQFVGADASKVQSNVAFIYLLSKIFLLGSAIVTIMGTPTHMNILLRESINDWYDMSAFFWSRTIIETIVNCAIGLTLPIGMWMMSMQIQDPTLAIPYVLLTICLHCVITHHFSFIIAMFSDVQSLPQLPFAIAMLHVCFGGYFVHLNELPKWIFWMRYINFGSFSHSALVKIAYATLTKPITIPCKLSSELIDPQCHRFKTGLNVLDFWGMNPNQAPLSEDLIALSCYVIIFVVLSWGLLAVYLDKAKRVLARC